MELGKINFRKNITLSDIKWIRKLNLISIVLNEQDKAKSCIELRKISKNLELVKHFTFNFKNLKKAFFTQNSG